TLPRIQIEPFDGGYLARRSAEGHPAQRHHKHAALLVLPEFGRGEARLVKTLPHAVEPRAGPFEVQGAYLHHAAGLGEEEVHQRRVAAWRIVDGPAGELIHL